MASTNDLKNGLVLNLEGQLWSVVEFQHVKPGKGPAFVRTKLKAVLSGKVVDKTFNAGTKVETANVDKRTMAYLYKDGDDYVFMDTDTYDQVGVPGVTVGGAADYMLENQNAIVATHDGAPLYVELPPSVVLEVTHTEPGLQGDRSTGGTKPATLETGAQINVPLFLEQGTRVKVDTRDGSYLGRVNDWTGDLVAARTKARSRALDILFEADQRGVDAEALLDERLAQVGLDGVSSLAPGSLGSRAGNNPYTAVLVRGVTGRWSEINAALTDYSQGWTLDRMPAVDRAILRLGAWEVLWNDEIPDAVAISEAVGLAAELSTDDSPTFVNGLLGRLAEVKATIV